MLAWSSAMVVRLERSGSKREAGGYKFKIEAFLGVLVIRKRE